MLPVLYLCFASFLLFSAYIVFRKRVRRDYLERGRLTPLSSLLQLLVFVALMCFPYLYNPPGWDWFWKVDLSTDPWYRAIGLALIIAGFVVAFGTMGWFGLRRAFGVQASGLVQTGTYRFSRNPQILGGYLLVLGVALQWPSLYSLGWIILYGVIAHMMIVTEEEYLTREYGSAYDRYVEDVPRYIRFSR
jgi:protein-S-isoprenylcysteine O-methyltransferase Ste14